MLLGPSNNLSFGIAVFGPDTELAKHIAEAISSNGSGGSVSAGFITNDPTVGAIRIGPQNMGPHDATILVGVKMPDRNTINELNRITPAAKPMPANK